MDRSTRTPRKTPRTATDKTTPTTVLFEVVEKRIIGTVHEGDNGTSPLEAGFALMAEGLADRIAPGETVEVGFSYLDHVFTARAQPHAQAPVDASSLSDSEVRDLARERGIDIYS